MRHQRRIVAVEQNLQNSLTHSDECPGLASDSLTVGKVDFYGNRSKRNFLVELQTSFP